MSWYLSNLTTCNLTWTLSRCLVAYPSTGEKSRRRKKNTTSKARISCWVRSLDAAHLVRSPFRLEMEISIRFWMSSHWWSASIPALLPSLAPKCSSSLATMFPTLPETLVSIPRHWHGFRGMGSNYSKHWSKVMFVNACRLNGGASPTPSEFCTSSERKHTPQTCSRTGLTARQDALSACSASNVVLYIPWSLLRSARLGLTLSQLFEVAFDALQCGKWSFVYTRIGPFEHHFTYVTLLDFLKCCCYIFDLKEKLLIRFYVFFCYFLKGPWTC